MKLPHTDVLGTSGPPVLLLPGGAEAADGFFPGLVEGLIDDPGARVIIHDRPGTGTSDEDGLLADAADHLHGVIGELGLGPVVLVGQSLGGAVAILLAIKHPDDVGGLVLLDPTPITDVAGAVKLERAMGISRRLYGVPGLRQLIQGQLRRGMRRSVHGMQLREDCRVALEKIGDVDLAKLALAVRGIGGIAAEVRLDDLPAVPAAVILADRPDDHPYSESHLAMARALGVERVRWPGAAHNVQVTHPDETLAAVRGVVGQVARTR